MLMRDIGQTRCESPFPILLLRDKIGPIRRLPPVASRSSRARHGCFLPKAERAKGRAGSAALIAQEQTEAEKLTRDIAAILDPRMKVHKARKGVTALFLTHQRRDQAA
jgi:hypothetical protein